VNSCARSLGWVIHNLDLRRVVIPDRWEKQATKWPERSTGTRQHVMMHEGSYHSPCKHMLDTYTGNASLNVTRESGSFMPQVTSQIPFYSNVLLVPLHESIDSAVHVSSGA
jgi:hypothetical protein